MKPANRVQRHFAGRAPAFATEKKNEATDTRNTPKEDAEARVSTSASVIHRKSATTARRRQIYDGEIVSIPSATPVPDQRIPMTGSMNSMRLESESDDESEDEEDLRRRRRREQALMREQAHVSQSVPAQPAQAQPTAPSSKYHRQVESSSDEEESSSSSSSSEEEEEQPMQPILFKPVFKAKTERQSATHSDLVDQEQQQYKEQEAAKLEQRKKETHQMVAEMLKNEVMEQRTSTALDGGDGLWMEVDDTDNPENEQEFEEWKLRELTRLKRDKEERLRYIEELKLIEQRREMTDRERREDELKAGIDRFHKEKGQQKFMQKFFHKGAFYLDEHDDLVKKRDFTAPTLEDRFNKETLPEIMQRREFGKKGQSKWTHLAAEDTSRRDAGWAMYNDLTRKRLQQQGGIHDIELPTRKKHRSDNNGSS